MKYEKLNGIWKGCYKYGEGYPENHKWKKDPFSLHIQFDGANFKGICQDIYTETLFNAPATIEGIFVPNKISFIKKYPALLALDENMQTIVDPDKPSFEIHYTGLFYKSIFSKTIRFEGEWSITNFYINESGKIEFFTSCGTWSMKK